MLLIHATWEYAVPAVPGERAVQGASGGGQVGVPAVRLPVARRRGQRESAAGARLCGGG